MTMNRASVDAPAVQLFHSLADPARLEIVRLLGSGERRVVDLTAELGLAQSTVSGHLSCLRNAGLVEPHPHGRSTYYALIRPELWAMLAAAENVLAASGSPAGLRPDGVGTDGAADGAHAEPHADTVVAGHADGHADGHVDGHVDGHRARPDAAAPAARPGKAH